MARRKWDAQQFLFGDPGPPGAGLSVGVVVLLLVAGAAAALAILRLPDSLLGVGLMCMAVFLAICARICQARNQHQALYRLLTRHRPP
ncbi:MAG: hypothetical protein GAK31_00830 [Stenotrophomonas maltophilia]|uniref:Transmembrane protein n=1 Tax=Stenotrophomonas maltophilia TaxID=40324 RepID=A0A7V8JNB7_STEMA|nr:MAG: hypothetical protein GAK31_00830 [Stenotrophomonas maltophilia]